MRRSNTRLHRSLWAGLAAALALAWSSTPAFGALTHAEVQKNFTTACSQITDLAVHEATETVYVACATGGLGGSGAILKYSYEGVPTNFSATKPYIVGNAIVESQVTSEGTYEFPPHIAVDNSGGPSDGNLYVATGSFKQPEIFKPSGEFVGTVGKSSLGYVGAIDVGPGGQVYVKTGGWAPQASKFSVGGTEVGRYMDGPFDLFNPAGSENFSFIAVDSTGAIWQLGDGKLQKFEADQFRTKFPPGGQFLRETEAKKLTATPSTFVPLPFVGGHPQSIAVDTTTNDLYADYGSTIRVFSPGSPAESSYEDGPSISAGPLVNSTGITATADHRLFASTENSKVIRFGPGDIVPDVHTHPADVDQVGHQEATVGGEVELAGGTSVSECVVQVGTGTNYALPPVPCSPGSFSEDKEVTATLTGLTTGVAYHYRVKATNAKGSNAGIDRTVIPAFVLKLKTLAASELEEHSATLRGSFEPDASTTYYFEYGIDGSYGVKTAPVVEGASPGVVLASTELDSLASGKTYHYRIVASNSNGKTFGPDATFRTTSPPEVSGLQATEVRETSATLIGRVNPVGYASEYRFEYGTTPEYGQATPWTAIGEGTAPVEVLQKVASLQPGVTYHFRLDAKNEWGVNESLDTTFDFTAPACPNDYVRQQTNSSYLPDCRAYELVSPPKAGAVLLFPSSEYPLPEQIGLGGDEYGEYTLWPQNTGLASSPSRFSFASITGTIEGLHAPNGVLPDTYISTRTSRGWQTTLPGLPDTYGHPSRKQCSDSMDLCIEGSYPEGAFFNTEVGAAPYLFNIDGKMLGRLPSNVNIVPDGAHYRGARRISDDFSHFVFSSNNVVFAPGGVTGGGRGSAYDNDLAKHTVKLISTLQSGEPIPQFGSSTHAIEFPGLSADGTHVLMQTEQSAAGPFHLYMRVNDAVTYELTPPLKTIKEFVGMTRDGQKVFFTSSEQLTAEDTDSSVDLYMWTEGGGGTLTLISQGNGNGNSADCAASWGVSQCGIAPLSTEHRWAAFRESEPGHPPYYDAKGLDDMVAEESGDVYFFSPELLDGSRFGVKDQRNLYVYRHGAVQLVATLDPGTDIYRMQISKDGRYAAMLSDSRLTPYDNEGFREMYTYDAETGAIHCASCPPDGSPPTADATGSQGGPYMANDGRTFFATGDDLVPRDKDGLIDVYEYVDGRPQLISSGVSARDFTGGSELITIFFSPVHTGLESVSRDGTDVYFSTYDTLVEEDLNGEFVKFYDARSGGGFAPSSAHAPCAAADECHGADSSPPAPGVVTSTADLGSGGNVTATKPKRKHKPHRRKKPHRARRGHG